MNDRATIDEHQAKSEGSTPHWPSRIVGAALLAWIVTVTALVQVVSWTTQQLSVDGAGGGLDDPDFVATLVQGLLLLLPLAPVAIMWKRPRYRTIFRLWFLAALFALFSAVIHIPGATEAYISVGLQIAVALAFLLGLVLLDRAPNTTRHSQAERWSSVAVALALSPVLLLPWVDVGALGTPIEAVLNLVAALLFGLCAGLLLRRLQRLDLARSQPAMQLAGGFVVGAALAPMAASYGFGGNQLLLLLVVPSIAWVAVSLLNRGHTVLALATLVGLTAAGPMMFIDPREMALALSFGLFSTLGLAFRAAAISLFLAWTLGALLVLWRQLRRDRQDPAQPQAAFARLGSLLLPLPSWLMLLAVLFFAGHPGFFGDHLFVILGDQADVSVAAEFESVVERRRFVYDTLVERAETTQEALRRDLSQWGIDYTPYYLVNGLEVEGGPILRAWLQNRAEVEEVLYSPILRPAPPEGTEPVSAEEPLDPPWNITMIGADRVWNEFGVRGAGVVIGQSDSGVQWDHPQLVDAYRGSAGQHDYNWFDPWYHTQQPVDTGGHGTHTLGTVLGETTGVAPGASWFGCANLARNVGSTAYYLDCMQFMLAPFPLGGDPFHDGDPALGANVLNNSWGCPELEGCDDTSLLPAVTALRQAGTFVAVSAGNEGPECSSLNSPPAIYDQSFSIGAVDRFGIVTLFSSRGPVTFDGSLRTKPDIMAPGQDILSAYPDNRYRSWQGTSMAGPHVAGVVALMWSANPALVGDVETTEEILIATAQPPPSGSSPCSDDEEARPNNTYGYGIVDAYAAVRGAIALSAN